MAFRFLDLLHSRTHLLAKKSRVLYLNTMLCHSWEESRHDVLPSKWYENAFPRISELSQTLKNVDSINGRLVDVSSNATIVDDRIEHEMGNFKSLVRGFIGSPFVQRKVKRTQKPHHDSISPFSKASEREPITVDSLTKISNFLEVSAQQRKVVL